MVGAAPIDDLVEIHVVTTDIPTVGSLFVCRCLMRGISGPVASADYEGAVTGAG